MRDSITSVRDAILIGLVLAAIILVLFLRDWGSSIVAGLVIPATIAITLIVLRWLGESFDLMTLGGLAAAVGLVIDDYADCGVIAAGFHYGRDRDVFPRAGRDGGNVAADVAGAGADVDAGA